MNNDLDRRLANWNPVRTEDLADAHNGGEATTLLRRILAEPAEAEPARRHVAMRSLVAAGLAVVMLAAGGWVVLSRAHAPATRVRRTEAVLFSTRGDVVVARITDPSAATSELTAAFEAHGLNIHVNAVPASPSVVGTIVYTDAPAVRSLQSGACVAGGFTCEVGLVIPADFTGEANVTVGRAAAPGELYESSDDVFGPGEVLHCSGIVGGTVSSAIPILQAKGLDVRWDTSDATDVANPPLDGYVADGTALSSTGVLLDVVSAPLPDTSDMRKIEAAENQGC